MTSGDAHLYHITASVEADRARELGHYTPESFQVEGFIHCSYREQVTSVADRMFRGRAGLVLFEIDLSRLEMKVVDENLEGGCELFPHLYGRLPMPAVVRTHSFPCDGDGRFALPKPVSSRANSAS